MRAFKLIKKFLKILLISSISLIILLVSLTYIFKDDIIELVVEEVNKKVKTKITYQDIDINVFRNFPHVSVIGKNLTIEGSNEKAPDTLAHINDISITFDLFDLIQKEYSIRKVKISDASFFVRVDKNGVPNYDILYQDSSKTKDTTGIKFDVKSIALENINIIYDNKLTEQDHYLTIQSSKAKLIHTPEQTAINIKGDYYFHQISIKEKQFCKDKNIQINTQLAFLPKKKKIEIKKSDFLIEQSKFSLKGGYSFGDTSKIDLKFKAVDGNIQTMLSLLPGETYERLKRYKSEGNFNLDGEVYGQIDATHTPQINCNFGFSKTKIYHPASKQNISNASMVGSFTNGKHRNANSTQLKIKNLKGNIGGKPFNMNLLYQNLNNPYIDFNFKGAFSFAGLLNIIPKNTVKRPSGDLSLDVSIKGAINNLTNKYKTHLVKTKGNISLDKVNFYETSSKLAYKNINGHFSLSKGDLLIKDFEGWAGNSEIKLDGRFDHFLSFLLFDSESVYLNANLKSDILDLDELLHSRDTTGTQSGELHFGISPKLNFDFSCDIKKIKFDRACKGQEYKNLKGVVKLRSQIIKFPKISFKVAGGTVALTNGTVNAQLKENIKVTTTASLQKLKVDSLFYLTHDFRNTMLTYKNLKGQINGDIKAFLVYNSKLDLQHHQIDIDNKIEVLNGELNNFKPLMDLYDYMASYEDKKIMKLLGVKIYKFFKTDNPKVNNFKKLTFKPLKTNDINVRNNTIDITRIFLESNAGVVELWGNQNYATDEIDYRIAVQLKNYHKINKARANDAQYGNVAEDNSDGLWLHYIMDGSLEKYNFRLDWKRLTKQKKQKLISDLKIEKDKDPEYVAPDVEDLEFFD